MAASMKMAYGGNDHPDFGHNRLCNLKTLAK
jgi:hypothetical protein